jgi:RimJ/RimL family protein N-acetyltransferase
MNGELGSPSEMSVTSRKGRGVPTTRTPGKVQLRRVRESDLRKFFEYQSDPEARWMAAFGNDPTAPEAFLDRWIKMLRDPKVDAWTVLLGGRVVGNIVLFELLGEPSVGYWYSREVWGRGVATRGLREFLRRIPTRPLFARVAKDNFSSVRVLEKCGFMEVGKEKGFAPTRNAEVEELIFRRDAR